MNGEQKNGAASDRRMGTLPLLVLPLWVTVTACFFYYLVRAGLPLQ